MFENSGVCDEYTYIEDFNGNERKVGARICDNITNHFARHTFITEKANEGWSFDKLSYCTGHSDDAMIRKVYAHLGDDYKVQSVVKEINDRCNSQVWVACTAQQDLKEILDNCQINETSNDFGKILGRFEVQASLSGTSSEYIAQKRILAKKPEGETELTRFYNRSASAIETQFQLPNTYEGYRDKDTFINYYPFVPYQLELIKNVFTNFVELSYVNKEVKGNVN